MCVCLGGPHTQRGRPAATDGLGGEQERRSRIGKAAQEEERGMNSGRPRWSRMMAELHSSCFHLFISTPPSASQPQSALMDLMSVPEPRATADPWGAGAGAAAPEDPWQSYGTHTHSKRAHSTLGRHMISKRSCTQLSAPPAAPRTHSLSECCSTRSAALLQEGGGKESGSVEQLSKTAMGV